MRYLIAAPVILFVSGCSGIFGDGLRSQPEAGYDNWEIYGGGNEQLRYSRLTQIHRGNVAELAVAWKYDTGDESPGTEIQCNPLVVDGVLYGSSPDLRIFAVNAATGELMWSHRPMLNGEPHSENARHRGFMFWRQGDDTRLYFAARHMFYALDAATGKPVPEFGNQGAVDLRENFDRPVKDIGIGIRTPGVVFNNMLIVGSIVSESLPSAPGDIRAYDARTGELRWSFHTIPHPGEPGYQTWPEDVWKTTGGANSWAGMALDEQRGLVFAGTGSAAFDFWGGNRAGDNLYANSLLCLRADTGELVWHFQFVKHDIWDRDLPTPPQLVTIEWDGQLLDAVAQSTKSNHVFVFDRETGEPLTPLQEIEVPVSDVSGEVTALTQVLPLDATLLGRQEITEDDLTHRTPEAHKAVLERFRQVRSGPQFSPPSLQGTIVFPGFDGGAEWGGQAFDPETGLLYVNSSEMAWILRLVEQRELGAVVNGKRLYQRYCAACHLDDLSGTPPNFPTLKNLEITNDQFGEIVRQGAGRMPGFAHLQDGAVLALRQFVLHDEDGSIATGSRGSQNTDMPYTHDGYNRFLDPDGYPAIAPPWGTMNALDIDSGELVWRVPLGEYPELAEQGMTGTGTENYGGPVVTAGGLLFIGATARDKKFRAFDKITGKILWETTLPAGGNATPAVYEVEGRQFVVIAAGGGKTGGESGGSYVAFSLPSETP